VTEPEREPERCCFDDWVDHWERQARKKDTVAGVSARLVEALAEAGLAGRTVLDVGCGIGDLAMAMLARGAASATGFDLSPKAIEQARALAERRGLSERTTFEIGDGSTADLPSADVVVLNRVVCCFPDADGLLDRSLAAAGSVYALTAPVSRGPAGLLNRAQTTMSNAWYALRKERYQGFRTFVHDMGRIDQRVRSAGFRPLRREHRRVVWDLAVYAR
jgi:magnesium-protoporphyrin O-methyltransferase